MVNELFIIAIIIIIIIIMRQYLFSVQNFKRVLNCDFVRC